MPSPIWATETLVMQPGESLLFSCDMTNLLQGSAVLNSSPPTVTATPSGSITVGAGALDSSTLKVEVRISAGTDEVDYTIEFTSTDDASNTHEVNCRLQVRD